MKENEDDIAIKVDHVYKSFNIYYDRANTLKERMLFFARNKRKEKREVLKDINLDIKKGETVALIGVNGSGKSTLLKLMTQIIFPNKGTIETRGKLTSLLELGAGFHPDFSGRENIYFNSSIFGLTRKEIDERLDQIIEFSELQDFIDNPVRTYSSGMFARLAFACAINVDPDILIVDEVLSVGDMAFQLKCFKKFQQFKEKGKTILFVTHNVSDVLKNCTRVIILENGKKTFDGDVKEGVELYKKIITGNAPKNKEENKKVEAKKKTISKDTNTWKSHFNQNPNLIEYGNLDAEVIDYGIFDTNGQFLTLIDNEKTVVLKSKIKFHKEVDNPIFTMTIKNFNGVEVAGTNTMIEKIYPGKFKTGDIVEVEFIQKLPLAPDKYTLSFSCTHINANGELEVLNRKYEALLIEIISSKNCVGMVSLDTKIKISKK